jgi:hypothetical protein
MLREQNKNVDSSTLISLWWSIAGIVDDYLLFSITLFFNELSISICTHLLPFIKK